MVARKIIKQLIDFEFSFWDQKSHKESKELYKEIFDNNLITHSPLGLEYGHNTVMDSYLKWFEAFPRINLRQSVFTEIKNLIIWEWNCLAKHEKRFLDIEPTNTEINFTGKTIYQILNGKIVDYTCYVDMLNIYKQIGHFLQNKNKSISNINSQDLLLTLLSILEKDKLYLTEKEIKILSYWLFGYSSKEIANLFDISYRTVEWHIEQIKYKFLCNYKNEIRDFILTKNIMHLFYELYNSFNQKSLLSSTK